MIQYYYSYGQNNILIFNNKYSVQLIINTAYSYTDYGNNKMYTIGTLKQTNKHISIHWTKNIKGGSIHRDLFCQSQDIIPRHPVDVVKSAKQSSVTHCMAIRSPHSLPPRGVFTAFIRFTRGLGKMVLKLFFWTLNEFNRNTPRPSAMRSQSII